MRIFYLDPSIYSLKNLSVKMSPPSPRVTFLRHTYIPQTGEDRWHLHWFVLWQSHQINPSMRGGGHTHTLQYGGSRSRNKAPLPRPPKLVPVTSERLDLQDRTKSSPPSPIHPRGPRLLSVSYRTHQRWLQ